MARVTPADGPALRGTTAAARARVPRAGPVMPGGGMRHPAYRGSVGIAGNAADDTLMFVPFPEPPPGSSPCVVPAAIRTWGQGSTWERKIPQAVLAMSAPSAQMLSASACSGGGGCGSSLSP